MDYTTTEHATGLLQFIRECPTAYHTVQTISNLLLTHGFEALQEHEPWNLEEGRSYFVVRNQSSIIAFSVPEMLDESGGYQIIATHGDFPAFKLKSNFEKVSPDGYIKLNVEKYGGMICSSWMDRPLSIAGRVVVATNSGVESKLLQLQDDVAIIPNVAIHMNRNVNEGVAINAQVDMLPFVGMALSNEKGSMLTKIAAEVGVPADQIKGHDLFLYARDAGSVWGLEHEMISAPRLDNLMCTYAALQGFLRTDATDAIRMLAVFDNEEVGSSTRQGAASSFLEDVLTRVDQSLYEGSEISLHCRLANSMMLSADNAHAVHPNHPEYADADNRPQINHGIVIKYHAGQQYTTDAIGAALFKKLCEDADIPHQAFANRSDMRGGSTLGNIAVTRVPILSVDIGVPQLAMHSAYETAGVDDLNCLLDACAAFYQSVITNKGNGRYYLETGC